MNAVFFDDTLTNDTDEFLNFHQERKSRISLRKLINKVKSDEVSPDWRKKEKWRWKSKERKQEKWGINFEF